MILLDNKSTTLVMCCTGTFMLLRSLLISDNEPVYGPVNTWIRRPAEPMDYHHHCWQPSDLVKSLTRLEKKRRLAPNGGDDEVALRLVV